MEEDDAKTEACKDSFHFGVCRWKEIYYGIKQIIVQELKLKTNLVFSPNGTVII